MKKRALFVVAFLTAFLCACSRSEQSADAQQQEDENAQTQVQVLDDSTDWVVRGTVLPVDSEIDDMSWAPDGGWTSEYLCTLSGGAVYRYVALKEGIRGEDETITRYFFIETMEPPYEENLLEFIYPDRWIEGDSCTSWSYHWSDVVTEDGMLVTLLRGEESTYIGWCIGWWREDVDTYDTYKAEVLEKEFIQLGGDEANDIEFMYVDAEQDPVFLNMHMNIYLADSKGILLGGTEQDIQRISSVDGQVLHIGKNEFQGQLYHSGYTADAGFYVQSMESEKPDFSTDAVTMSNDNIVVWSSETEGYLCTSDAVWKFSIDKQEINRIVQLSYQGAIPSQLMGAEVDEDGTIRLLTKVRDRYVLLEVSQETGQEGKVILELATYNASESLKQAVFRFNESNSEYYVEIREAEEGITLPDFRTRIQAELSAGNGTDLVAEDVFANSRVDQMADKKLLLDLTEFFREEEDNILPNVWECGKVEGNIYAVPYAFTVRTLSTNKSLVGERTGWTVEELIQCVRQSGVRQFCSAVNDGLLFWYLCGGSGIDSDIIDWENRTCHFDSEKAEELLKFAGEYSGENDYLMAKVKVLEGETFTQQEYLFGPGFFVSTIAVNQDGQVFIGYPTANGEGGHTLDPSMIGINPMTEHVEGAVAFLQYLIAEDMQEYISECMGRGSYIFNEFPVRKAALEHLYGYLLNVPTGEAEDEGKIFYEYPTEVQLGGGQYRFPILPFTEENVQQMRTVLETAKPWAAGADDILDIIDEETGAYFSGSKEAKDVLAVIQNRVQLYFDEMN